MTTATNEQNIPVVKAIPLDTPAEAESVLTDKDFFDEEEESPGTGLTMTPQPTPEMPLANSDEDNDFFDAGEDEDDTPDFAHMYLFDKKCLDCKALVPFRTKTYKSCHFSNGNEHCPAAQTAIVVRIPLEKIVVQFMNAEREGDTGKLARLYGVLSTKEAWYQEVVSKALTEARREQIKK